MASRAPAAPEGILEQLRGYIAGELIPPGDPRYDTARRVWNGSIDRYPALIVRPVNAADVVRTVEVAAGAGAAVAIRGGGHNVAGHGTCDDGVVLDLSRMRRVSVDPSRRRVVVQGGATWGDLDGAAGAFGLATTGGQVSTTGVAGLALGGGIGWLMRRYGLSCDNLESVALVSADGRRLRVTAGRHDDLFWALRGGGGNFGVATSLTFRVHPVSEVLAGVLLYPLAAASEVFRRFRSVAEDAPDDLSMIIGFWVPQPGGGGAPMLGIGACWVGARSMGERVLRPLRQFGPLAHDGIQPMRYPDLQRIFDAGSPPGNENYARAGYLADLSDDLIELIVRLGRVVPSPLSQATVVQLGGAVAREVGGPTAFGHRHARYLLNILPIWEGGEGGRRCVEWGQRLWDAVRPFSMGVYVNFLAEEGPGRVRAAYGDDAFRRLIDVKTRYDPGNVFRINQNIAPRARTA